MLVTFAHERMTGSLAPTRNSLYRGRLEDGDQSMMATDASCCAEELEALLHLHRFPSHGPETLAYLRDSVGGGIRFEDLPVSSCK